MVIIGMSEYINKEYIRNIVQGYWDGTCGDGELGAYSRVLDDIDDAPVIDVKHGYWIEEKHSHWSNSYGRVSHYTYTYKCSECEKSVQLYSNFCPNCGSKNKLKTEGGYNLGW